MATTRTYGPIHPEDLDPKRFEDLIRQLVYDFRVWRKLEATGRSGSDDGFDVRGFEVVAQADAPERDEDTDDQDQPSPEDSDRLWLIQCKREKRIGPAQLGKYLDGIKSSSGLQLYGLIFVGICDFSKTARDLFADRCRQMGITEFYIWGGGELEDMLFQPKNDHLLFAYFGFSITIRQRSLRTALRSIIATKRKLRSLAKKIDEDYQLKYLVFRNVNGDIYPHVPALDTPVERAWRLCQFEELRHDGLLVQGPEFFAYVDGKDWDAADALGANSRNYFQGRWHGDSENTEIHDQAHGEWIAFENGNRAKLRYYAMIPYERILAIDDTGDECFPGWHLHCQADAGGFSIWGYAMLSVGLMREHIDDAARARRVQKFSAALRYPKGSK